MPRRLRALALGLMLVSVLSPAAHAQGQVRIGVIVPLSGPLARVGEAVRIGSDLAADEINNGGGVLGRKIDLVIRDDGGKPDQAQAAARAMSAERVVAIAGLPLSSSALAVAAAKGEAFVPILTQGVVAVLTRSRNPWMFRMNGTPKIYGEALAEHLKEIGARRAYTIAADYFFGKELADGVADAFIRSGLPAPQLELAPLAATDYSASLSKVKAAAPDLLVVAVPGAGASTVLKQATAMGSVARTILVIDSWVGTAVREGAGEGSLHLVSFAAAVADDLPDPARTRRFVSAATSRGVGPDDLGFAARAYDSIHAVATAIRAKSSLDADAIRQGLWRVNFAGASGAIAFVPDGPSGAESGQLRVKMHVVQIRGGQLARFGASSAPPVVSVPPLSSPPAEPSVLPLPSSSAGSGPSVMPLPSSPASSAAPSVMPMTPAATSPSGAGPGRSR